MLHESYSTRISPLFRLSWKSFWSGSGFRTCPPRTALIQVLICASMSGSYLASFCTYKKTVKVGWPGSHKCHKLKFYHDHNQLVRSQIAELVHDEKGHSDWFPNGSLFCYTDRFSVRWTAHELTDFKDWMVFERVFKRKLFLLFWPKVLA